MAIRNYIDNAPQTTLPGAIGTTDTSITVASLAGYPTTYPYTATLDLATGSAEQVLVTGSVSGTTVTVTRNYNGHGAFTHAAGATFSLTAIAQDFSEANTHVNSTTAVHGLGAGSAVVGTTDTQTLTNKSLTSPTLTGTVTNSATTNLTAAGTALAVTNNATVGGTLGVTGTATLGAVNASGAVALSAAGTALSVTNNATVGGTLGVTGTSTLGAVNASGAVTASAAGTGLSVTNNATVGGTATLGVVNASGAVTLSAAGTALSVTNTAAVGGLTVGGNPVQGGAWTTYTPGWFGATINPALGNGTLSGRWCQVGKLIIANWALSYGSTTNSGGGVWTFGLPVTAGGSGTMAAGRIFAANSGTYYTHGVVTLSSGGTVCQPYLPASNTASNVVQMRYGTPWNFTSGDFFEFTIEYEAA